MSQTLSRVFSYRSKISVALGFSAIAVAISIAGALIAHDFMRDPSVRQNDFGAMEGAPLGDEVVELRGRVAALENHAAVAAEAIERMASLLPRPAPTADELAGKFLEFMSALTKDGAKLPVAETPGSSSAVTVIATVDLRCPFCKGAHRTVASLAAAGDARIVFLPVGLLGEESKLASVAILAMASLSPQAGMHLLDRLFTQASGVNALGIEEAVGAVLAAGKVERSVYDARLDAARALSERATRGYNEAMGNSGGVPFYVRVDGSQPRAALGFRSDADLRQALGF